MNLRPYQIQLVERVRTEYRTGARSVLMQLGTGGGKTATASTLIERAVAKGKRVVFAAHLDALIDDTSERLAAAGIAHGIAQADRPTNPSARVQVVSLATLHRRGERPPADLVIVDECHRAMAASVRAVLEGYPNARLLGLSATPERGDGQPLGDVFERIVCGPSVAALTAQGHLVPAVVLSPPASIEGGLAMDPVDALETHAPGQPAMVFCRDAEHARDVASRLGRVLANRSGRECHEGDRDVEDGLSDQDRVHNTHQSTHKVSLAALPARASAGVVLILGDTPREDRRAARQRLADGERLALIGCGVFVEGWDSPEVRAIVLARTFGGCGGFLQACGRALRPSPGKTHATVIDLTGAAIMHGLPADERVWSLEGNAVRRTGEALAPLARCKACLAVFHAGPAQCPRCNAHTKGARLPRRATRVERAELARLDTRPQVERDAMAIRGIEKRLQASGRFPQWRVPSIARSIFDRTKKRAPEPGPEAA